MPKKFNPLHKGEIKEIISYLINNPPQNFKAAAQWFGTFHEFSCAVSQAQTILELNLNLDNRNKVFEKKLQEFEQNVLSQLLNSRETLMNIYLNSPFKYSMHAYDNKRIEKDIHARKKFSIPQLSALQIEENEIIREYKKFTNSACLVFEGQNVLLSAVAGKIHSPLPHTRKNAFLNYWQFIKKNEKIYQSLFDRLLHNRRAQAQVAGSTDYVEVAFAELGRFDYGVADCVDFRQSILSTVVPMLAELSQSQLLSLREKTLAPWDQQVWPDLNPSAPPAHGSFPQLLIQLQTIMKNIHPSFGHFFADMQEKNLMDITYRPGKSSGSFSVTFQESEVPFIFGNFTANLRDTLTLIHEFGHCLHGYAVTNIKNILLRHPGFEFCEIASIGLELLASKFFCELWPSEEDGRKALKYQLFQMLQFWPFMAMIDEWQHKVYAASHFMDAEERNELWLQISQKYKPYLDWTGYQELECLGWLARPHIFTSPFYYIDYGIAQVGALQMWLLSQSDFSGAVEKYICGLGLGAQLDLPSLFREMGLQFDFSEKLIKHLAQQMLKHIVTERGP